MGKDDRTWVDHLRSRDNLQWLKPSWRLFRKLSSFAKSGDSSAGLIFQNISSLLAEDPLIRLEEFDGVFRLPVTSDLFQRIVSTGCYEPELARIVKKYIDRDRDAIDVGANVGFFSCLMAKQISGKVLAVEPTDGAFERLVKNINLNRLDGRIETFKGVASDSNGKCSISVVLGREEYSSIGRIIHPSVAISEKHEIEVLAQTIDSLVALHDLNPGFMKIDTEGAEGMVLKGAMNTIRQSRPVILSEMTNVLLKDKGYTSEAIFATLKAEGYKILNPIDTTLAANPKYCSEILAIPLE